MKKQIKIELLNIIKIIKKYFCFVLDVIFSIIFALLFYKNNEIKAIIIIVIFLIFQFIKNLVKKSRLNFPILKEDLTIKTENGNVVPKKGDLEKIIIYCNVIENYIKDNNLRD